jgi:hypothetical protein
VFGFIQHNLAIASVHLKNPNIIVNPQRFNGFRSILVMLGMENLDFSNVVLIFHMNPMLRVCGSIKIMDSTAYAMSRLECGFSTENFKPFIKTPSSECVRICLEKLRINFLQSEVGVDKTLFCLLLSRENLQT